MEPTTYTLHKGTILYRGDTPYYLNNINNSIESLRLVSNKPTFFALSPDDVEQYGLTYGWEVPNDIVLPLIDTPQVMATIYEGANGREDVQKVMRKNYGFDPDRGVIGDRDSIFEKDVIFCKYLCENGYSGYASNDLEEGKQFTFEIMICNTDGYTCKGMFFSDEVGDKNLYINNQIQKYKDRIKPKEKKKSRKPIVFSPAKRILVKSPTKRNRVKSPAKINLIGSPSNMFESPVKGSNLFESPVKGSNLFESPSNLFESPVKGSNLFESPVKGSNLFESPVKGSNLFESPVKGSNLSESPVKGSNLFESPVKGNHMGGTPKKIKTIGGKSKKNRKTHTIRRR